MTSATPPDADGGGCARRAPGGVVGTAQHLHRTDAVVGEPPRHDGDRRAVVCPLPRRHRAGPSRSGRGDRCRRDRLAQGGGRAARSGARRDHGHLPEAHGPSPAPQHRPNLDRRSHERHADPGTPRGGGLLRAFPGRCHRGRHRTSPADPAVRRPGRVRNAAAGHRCARDFLLQPESYLRALCRHVGVDFVAPMLAWPPGPRDSDGVWGRYWYDTVWKSTGFAEYRRRDPQLDGPSAKVAEACSPMYERLHQARWVV